jgi:putative ABC transport system substrate-binding protein
MMERRTFLCASIAALAMPLTAEAQQVGGLPRIGVLASQSRESSVAGAFREGLREFGYVQGQNIVIAWR